jgi:deoxyribonuclease V
VRRLQVRIVKATEVSSACWRSHPNAPGLLAFRELPALVPALQQLRVTPDLLVCDGQGLAHPRRFGLACHVGVLTGLPAVGVAKRLLVGTFDEAGLGSERGAWSPLRDGDEVVGRALRTHAGVRPVFVSVGHRIDLVAACQHVLDLCAAHRLPETTRLADQLARRTLIAGLAVERGDGTSPAAPIR